jgi:tight adherence protein C
MNIAFGFADMLAIAAGAGAFLATLALAFGLSRDRRVAARIKTVSGRKRGTAEAETYEKSPPRKDTTMRLMRGIVGRAAGAPSQGRKQIALRLARAGWRSKDAVIVYLFFRLFLPLAGAGICAVLFYVMEAFELAPMMRVLAVVGGGLGGFLAPGIFLKNAIDKRRAHIRKSLPDALDLMVICTEAGLSLDATFKRVAGEISSASNIMADELTLVSSELSFLAERKQALDNLRQRVPLPQIQALCSTLVQTEKFGTPLAQALRVLATELRDERMLRAEEKAARLPAIMTIPLIIFILPALFVVVLGPAVLSIADSFMMR